MIDVRGGHHHNKNDANHNTIYERLTDIDFPKQPPQLASPQASIFGWLCWDAQRAIPDWMLKHVDVIGAGRSDFHLGAGS